VSGNADEREKERSARERESPRARAREQFRRKIQALKFFQSKIGLRWLILVADSGGAGTPGQLNRTHSGRKTMLTNRPQNGQTLSRSLSRTRFSLVPRTSSSPQRTLACCPPPAQVFSQQRPNQHAIFFHILKI
jgi:hypothetical protein